MVQVTVPRDDVNPWIYARVVARNVGDEWGEDERNPAGLKMELKRVKVEAASADARGLDVQPTDSTHRQVIGAAAGRLIKGYPLKKGAGAKPEPKSPKPIPVLTPEEKRRREDEWREAKLRIKRRRESNEASTRAITALIEGHHDEFKETKERERAMVAIENILDVRPWD